MSADRRTVLALSGAILAGMAGCTSGGDDTSEGGNGDGDSGVDSETNDGSGGESDGDNWDDVPAFPEVDPVTDPPIDDARLATQVRGNVAFSLALLEELGTEEPDENLFFSPYSVSVALAMAYAGADGETATEMREALRYELENEDLHAAFGALEDEFERRNEDGESPRDSVDGESPRDSVDGESPRDSVDGENDEDDLGFQLSSANALWAEESYPFDEAYFAVLERYYGAGDHTVDFAGDPEGAREEINGWVEAHTNDRIEDLLPQESIDNLTRLVLTNAVYFLAAWEHDFEPAATEPEPFTNRDGSETDVDMMHQREEFPYAAVDGHQLVELPYANGDTSMVVLLPAEGEFDTFADELSVDRLATLLEGASTREVDLGLPTFGIESAFSLVETMQSLGMEQAFTPDADLSAMVEGEEEELYVDDIVHQSFLEVDEEGTEAAAATGVVVNATAASPTDPVEMTVDRPFLFYIRDRPTETPLFVGRVVDGETL